MIRQYVILLSVAHLLRQVPLDVFFLFHVDAGLCVDVDVDDQHVYSLLLRLFHIFLDHSASCFRSSPSLPISVDRKTNKKRKRAIATKKRNEQRRHRVGGRFERPAAALSATCPSSWQPRGGFRALPVPPSSKIITCLKIPRRPPVATATGLPHGRR